MTSDVIQTYEFNLNGKLWEWKDRLLGQSISILYDGSGNDINDKSDIFPPFTRKEGYVRDIKCKAVQNNGLMVKFWLSNDQSFYH